MCLAALTLRVPALEDRLLVVQKMEARWDLRAAERGVARAIANSPGQECSTERRHRRLPIDQNDSNGRRAERILRWKEDARQ